MVTVWVVFPFFGQLFTSLGDFSQVWAIFNKFWAFLGSKQSGHTETSSSLQKLTLSLASTSATETIHLEILGTVLAAGNNFF